MQTQFRAWQPRTCVFRVTWDEDRDLNLRLHRVDCNRQETRKRRAAYIANRVIEAVLSSK